MQSRTSLICALVLGAWSLMPSTGLADKPKNITQGELAIAPTYCVDTMGLAGYGDAYYNTSPRAPHWVSLMGKGFWAMHHYCYALINLARSEKFGVSDQQRQALRMSAINDIDYVLTNTTESFVMRPELLVKKGAVLVTLHQGRAAVAAFREASQSKQDYWPAYTHWAELLRSNGKVEEAKTVVEAGLKYAPDAKLLQSMLADLSNASSKRAQPKKMSPQGQAAAPEQELKTDTSSGEAK